MPDTDDALLARLNALRKSPITLEKTPSTQQQPTDDLTARFRSLTRNSTFTSPLPAENDTEHNDQDDRTIEELLKDLGPEEEWTVQRDEGERIRHLMREAQSVLAVEEGSKEVHVEVQVAGGMKHEDEEEDKRQTDEADEQESQDERDDDEEADAHVQRVLAALALDEKYGETEADGEEEGSDAELALPCAPTGLPCSPAREPESSVDDALSARFASLSLPGVPLFNPAQKPVNIQKSVRKSNLPKYTDEDMESWCCICNEDATVKCIGCDGDLYCQECWSEGHGNASGQERGHRALAYAKDAS
jgi:hypothetical protein